VGNAVEVEKKVHMEILPTIPEDGLVDDIIFMNLKESGKAHILLAGIGIQFAEGKKHKSLHMLMQKWNAPKISPNKAKAIKTRLMDKLSSQRHMHYE
jgi:hypothetical protein